VITQVVTEVDKRKQEDISKSLVLDIHERLYYKKAQTWESVIPTRVHIFDDYLDLIYDDTNKRKKCYAVLFNDALLFTEPDREDPKKARLTFVLAVDFATTTIIDLIDTPELYNAFTLLSKEGSFTCVTAYNETKLIWFKKILTAIEAHDVQEKTILKRRSTKLNNIELK